MCVCMCTCVCVCVCRCVNCGTMYCTSIQQTTTHFYQAVFLFSALTEIPEAVLCLGPAADDVLRETNGMVCNSARGRAASHPPCNKGGAGWQAGFV